MDAAEAAVGEHRDHVAGAGGGGDLLDDFIDASQIPALAAVGGDVGGEFEWI